ncbi:MAG: hypothetical protein QM775_20900 [Pirellulales bacterium]
MTIVAHEPDGTTTVRSPANVSIVCFACALRQIGKPGVVERLPAAGLGLREIDLVPESSQEPDDGLTGLRPDDVAEAGDHE